MKKLYTVLFVSLGSLLIVSSVRAQRCGTVMTPSTNANCICEPEYLAGSMKASVGVWPSRVKDGTPIPKYRCTGFAQSFKQVCSRKAPVLYFKFNIHAAFVEKQKIYCKVGYSCIFNMYKKMSMIRSVSTENLNGVGRVVVPKPFKTQNEALVAIIRHIANSKTSADYQRNYKTIRVEVKKFQCQTVRQPGSSSSVSQCTIWYVHTVNKNNRMYWCQKQ